MSTWTHVAGIIRIDAFRLGGASAPNWDDIFGKELSYEELYDNFEEVTNHPEKFLPFGSEGSLQKSVWASPDKPSLASYTISIFGDLRDYEYSDEIIQWFKKKCDDVNTRQATIVVTSGDSNEVWSYSFGEEIK